MILEWNLPTLLPTVSPEAFLISEKPSCLGFLFRRFLPGSGEERANARPYALRDDFQSPAEASFFRVLRTSFGEPFVIGPGVGLGDVCFVRRPNENQRDWQRSDRREVDGVLCDPDALRPQWAIEAALDWERMEAVRERGA